jgi:hypothetical protein
MFAFQTTAFILLASSLGGADAHGYLLTPRYGFTIFVHDDESKNSLPLLRLDYSFFRPTVANNASFSSCSLDLATLLLGRMESGLEVLKVTTLRKIAPTVPILVVPWLVVV